MCLQPGIPITCKPRVVGREGRAGNLKGSTFSRMARSNQGHPLLTVHAMDSGQQQEKPAGAKATPVPCVWDGLPQDALAPSHYGVAVANQRLQAGSGRPGWHTCFAASTALHWPCKQPSRRRRGAQHACPGQQREGGQWARLHLLPLNVAQPLGPIQQAAQHLGGWVGRAGSRHRRWTEQCMAGRRAGTLRDAGTTPKMRLACAAASR